MSSSAPRAASRPSAGNRATNVQRSYGGALPAAESKPELAAAHAVAGCLIGMRAVYLEAGSGAERPVPAPVIRACRDAIAGAVPLLVGGGIREPEQAAAARAAGADFVVIGSALEAADDSMTPLRAFTRAVRP